MKGQSSSLLSRRLFRLIAIIVLFASISLFILLPAQAATIDVPCDVTDLVNAINTANSNGEADTLNLDLNCIYNLTATLNIEADGGNPLTVNGNSALLSGNNTVPVIVTELGTTLNLNGIQVSNGQAVGGTSGGIYNAPGGTLTLTNVTVSNNSANPSGGGGGILNDGGTLTINSSIVSDNTALFGGGIDNNFGTVTINGSTIIRNTATAEGGGIVNNGGTLTLTSSNIDENVALFGGGIHVFSGTVTLLNTALEFNTANGGGIYIDEDSTVELVNSRLFANNSTTDGGGIYIDLNGTAILTNSTLTENAATLNGGGIYIVDGVAMLTNSTLYRNSGNGGGIYNGGMVVLNNSTFYTNFGDGVINNGSLNLNNSIIANSQNGSDCVNPGSISSSGGNLVSDGSCSVPGAITGNPQLDILTGNPGYLPLLPGSPAIDSGDNPTCSAAPVNNLDQRGETRPMDGDGDGIAVCDLGSFEADGAPGPTSSPTSTPTTAAPTDTPTMTSTPSETPIFTSTPTATLTPSLLVPTATVPPPPPTPLCEDHNFAEGGVVRASTRDGLDYAINCRVLYQNGQPTDWLGGDLYNSGSIGIEGIFDLGVLQAVDIFSPVGRTHFEGGAVFCLRGQGTLIWLAASGAPRHAEIIGSYEVDDFPGFTCATLFEPGTLVLVRENPTQ